jgi:hypothetical protein
MTQKGSRGFTQIDGGETKSKLQIAFPSLIAIVEAGDVKASDSDSKVFQFLPFRVLRNARDSSHKVVRRIRSVSLYCAL